MPPKYPLPNALSSTIKIKRKAKVMSFEDIEAARAARAAKEVAKGKEKRGRKRKSAVMEAEGQDPEFVLAWVAQDVDEEEPARSGTADRRPAGPSGVQGMKYQRRSSDELGFMEIILESRIDSFNRGGLNVVCG
ncbi:hypothetical protein MKZ38_008526 [Zalerion maritima]|uniref:Uncharacterized protein n=1 Tax=Zalerion maritima TaxID=339359 RepID=A0AAD5RU57_9PEZI|nr:hypothetical protein MKZ38_008526 [Zalerion maritima]